MKHSVIRSFYFFVGGRIRKTDCERSPRNTHSDGNEAIKVAMVINISLENKKRISIIISEDAIKSKNKHKDNSVQTKFKCKLILKPDIDRRKL